MSSICFVICDDVQLVRVDHLLTLDQLDDSLDSDDEIGDANDHKIVDHPMYSSH